MKETQSLQISLIRDQIQLGTLKLESYLSKKKNLNNLINHTNNLIQLKNLNLKNRRSLKLSLNLSNLNNNNPIPKDLNKRCRRQLLRFRNTSESTDSKDFTS